MRNPTVRVFLESLRSSFDRFSKIAIIYGILANNWCISFRSFGNFSKHGLHIYASPKKCKAVVRRYFSKQVFLKVSQISQENTFAAVPFNKVTGLKAWNFIKKKLQHRCFPVKFAKCLRTYFLQNTSGGCFWKWKDVLSSFHFSLPWFSLMLCV